MGLTGRDPGVCHLCQTETVVNFCARCDHWFCDACQQKWGARLKEAIATIFRTHDHPCCGPDRLAVVSAAQESAP